MKRRGPQKPRKKHRAPDPTDGGWTQGGWIYAIREDAAPLVKIGFTRNRVH
jgi:hypothetical protein